MNRFKRTAAIIAILLIFLGQESSAPAIPSKKTLEAERSVIAHPEKENVSAYVKLLLKEYKREYRAKNYDEAADYLRSALYFLYQEKSEYQNTLSKLNALLQKTGYDQSFSNRLEIAKNLYLENKIFASAYEFTMLLKENYETDICFEYLGDISQKTGKTEASFSFYKKAAETNPENYNAKYKYANALLKAGKSDEAVYYFEDVIENTNSNAVINDIITTFTGRISDYPDDGNSYGILGLAYQKLGQYDKTYKLLKKSLMLNPSDIFLRYYLGGLLFDIKEFSFADEIYTEILNENPYESQIRIARAKSYGALNMQKKAINDYQVVLAMYPDSIQAQYGMYSLLKNQLPLEKIINLFYPLEPDYKLDENGYNDLGYHANKTEGTKDAILFFEKSLAINPKSETPYIELYKLYQLSGQNEKAKNILAKGYKAFPKNSEIIEMYSAASSNSIDENNNLALSYLNEGEYKKAITVYERIEPKNAATYEAIGSCYRQSGDFKNAITNYKKAIELNPDNSDTYYALGIAYLEANNTEKARDNFKKSVEKDSRNVKSKKMLSYIEQKETAKSLDLAYDFYEKKDYANALRCLNKAVETYPNDPKVYYCRALIKDALNDYKGAADDFKKSVEKDRSYTAAYFKLAETLEKLNKKKEALYMYEKYLGAENIDSEFAKAAEQRMLELGERYY